MGCLGTLGGLLGCFEARGGEGHHSRDPPRDFPRDPPRDNPLRPFPGPPRDTPWDPPWRGSDQGEGASRRLRYTLARFRWCWRASGGGLRKKEERRRRRRRRGRLKRKSFYSDDDEDASNGTTSHKRRQGQQIYMEFPPPCSEVCRRAARTVPWLHPESNLQAPLPKTTVHPPQALSSFCAAAMEGHHVYRERPSPAHQSRMPCCLLICSRRGEAPEKKNLPSV